MAIGDKYNFNHDKIIDLVNSNTPHSLVENKVVDHVPVSFSTAGEAFTVEKGLLYIVSDTPTLGHLLLDNLQEGDYIYAVVDYDNISRVREYCDPDDQGVLYQVKVGRSGGGHTTISIQTGYKLKITRDANDSLSLMVVDSRFPFPSRKLTHSSTSSFYVDSTDLISTEIYDFNYKEGGDYVAAVKSGALQNTFISGRSLTQSVVSSGAAGISSVNSSVGGGEIDASSGHLYTPVGSEVVLRIPTDAGTGYTFYCRAGTDHPSLINLHQIQGKPDETCNLYRIALNENNYIVVRTHSPLKITNLPTLIEITCLDPAISLKAATLKINVSKNLTEDFILDTSTFTDPVLPKPVGSNGRCLAEYNYGTLRYSDIPIDDILLKGLATAADLGLANVDNTSDLNKPISTAVQTALDAKMDGRVELTGLVDFHLGDLVQEGKYYFQGLRNNILNGPSRTDNLTAMYFVDVQRVPDPEDAEKSHIYQFTHLTFPLGSSGEDSISSRALSINAQGSIQISNWVKLANNEDLDKVNQELTTLNSTKADSVHSHTAADIGLGNVDNTSDLDKPISTAVQTALDEKLAGRTELTAPLDFNTGQLVEEGRYYFRVSTSEDLTNEPTLASDNTYSFFVDVRRVTDPADTRASYVYQDVRIAFPSGGSYFDELWSRGVSITAGGSVSQTDWNRVLNDSDLRDVNTTLDNKADSVHSHTKSEVGLNNVDNTSDLNKPISTATQTALDLKQDKVEGKGLSTNDFTDTYKDALDVAHNDAIVRHMDEITFSGTGNTVSGNTITFGLISDPYFANSEWSDQTYLGDVRLSFTVDSDWVHLVVGLGSQATSGSYFSKIDFGIWLDSSYLIRIYKSGTQLATYGTFAVGDDFVIERIGSTVYFKHNGATIHTEALTDAEVATPLGFDSSANEGKVTGPAQISNLKFGWVLPEHVLADKQDKEVGKGLSTNDFTDAYKTKVDGIEDGATADMTTAEIKSAYESNADTNAFTDAHKATVDSLPSDLHARNRDVLTFSGTGNTVSGNTITYGNAGAGVTWRNSEYSDQTYAGDVKLSFTADTNNVHIMVGLGDKATTSVAYNKINYAIFLLDSGQVRAYRGGANMGSYGAFSIGDEFSVERINQTVYFKRNGATFHTEALTAEQALQELGFDSSASDGGAKISNLKFGWLLPEYARDFQGLYNNPFEVNGTGVVLPNYTGTNNQVNSLNFALGLDATGNLVKTLVPSTAPAIAAWETEQDLQDLFYTISNSSVHTAIDWKYSGAGTNPVADGTLYRVHGLEFETVSGTRDVPTQNFVWIQDAPTSVYNDNDINWQAPGTDLGGFIYGSPASDTPTFDIAGLNEGDNYEMLFFSGNDTNGGRRFDFIDPSGTVTRMSGRGVVRILFRATATTVRFSVKSVTTSTHHWLGLMVIRK